MSSSASRPVADQSNSTALAITTGARTIPTLPFGKQLAHSFTFNIFNLLWARPVSEDKPDMPSKKDTAAAAKPANGTATKRFELPALDLKFGALTDGTDIPPPLPSPIREEAVPTPPDTPKEAIKSNGNTTAAAAAAVAAAAPVPPIATTAGVKRPAEDNPASPTLSARPGSIRRLFSRGLLNSAYVEGEGVEASKRTSRPPSRGASSVADSRKVKRSSGWFSRFRSDKTPLSPPATDEKKPTGPPPPMIPELTELKSSDDAKDEDGFGSDLFKDIK
ncbi:hypothetical protein QC764_120050 [Podospora pseudoanserina]|uniref:Uncharacterized protein n=1 Tax=Podospora pseudoanserina TaxID=2609844 RepID=A0ABR0IR44_9PEZI|nr:hypothetical protein QC764_120050 [Podospora pseudoanserina]